MPIRKSRCNPRDVTRRDASCSAIHRQPTYHATIDTTFDTLAMAHLRNTLRVACVIKTCGITSVTTETQDQNPCVNKSVSEVRQDCHQTIRSVEIHMEFCNEYRDGKKRKIRKRMTKKVAPRKMEKNAKGRKREKKMRKETGRVEKDWERMRKEEWEKGKRQGDHEKGRMGEWERGKDGWRRIGQCHLLGRTQATDCSLKK